jgi:hypothetical protein
MKVQHHINIDGPFWYRCKSVEFTGETATWELSRSGRYALLEAYQKAPHRQLVAASDDGQLRAFVRAWGPLRARLDAWHGTDSIDTYRNKRDELAARLKLIASVAEPERQRETLLELMRLSKPDSVFEIMLQALRLAFPIPGEPTFPFDPNIQSWIVEATQRDIQGATECLICVLPTQNYGGGFTVAKEGRRSVVRASLGISSLAEALEWMVWQDVFQGHPLLFCEECQRLISSDSKHVKKFCTPECAHRKTAREWQREKRRKKGESNVTQKAR